MCYLHYLLILYKYRIVTFLFPKSLHSSELWPVIDWDWKQINVFNKCPIPLSCRLCIRVTHLWRNCYYHIKIIVWSSLTSFIIYLKFVWIQDLKEFPLHFNIFQFQYVPSLSPDQFFGGTLWLCLKGYQNYIFPLTSKPSIFKRQVNWLPLQELNFQHLIYLIHMRPTFHFRWYSQCLVIFFVAFSLTLLPYIALY